MDKVPKLVQDSVAQILKPYGDHRRSRVLIDKNHLCQWLGKMPSATTTPKTGEEQK